MYIVLCIYCYICILIIVWLIGNMKLFKFLLPLQKRLSLKKITDYCLPTKHKYNIILKISNVKFTLDFVYLFSISSPLNNSVRGKN
jgi:hypothetical protein